MLGYRMCLWIYLKNTVTSFLFFFSKCHIFLVCGVCVCVSAVAGVVYLVVRPAVQLH